MAKESQNRYSKVAKDWGWREFVTLTSLFDIDLGFLANDTLTLCAEVRLNLMWAFEVCQISKAGLLTLISVTKLLSPSGIKSLSSSGTEPSLHDHLLLSLSCVKDGVCGSARWRC